MYCEKMIIFLLILMQFACYETTKEPQLSILQPNTTHYSFKIDYDKNQFLLDGRPFQYVSGSFHYFRTPKAFWRDRLQKIKAAGLNAISTYVEWSLHQPEINEWKWDGEADLIEFIRTVQEEGLLLLLRPGPYICAERDLGGLPYWLLNYVPAGKLRTNNDKYMQFVKIYLDNLFPRIQPFLRGNGGPIIMVQVENEYGSYNACDKEYMQNLANMFREHVGDKAVLYTTDGSSYKWLKCGSVPGVYATVDFGTKYDVENAFSIMRQFSPKGPLVNSEYYPGWLTHWGEAFQTVDTRPVVEKLKEMLALGASVDFYMFYGGTNFEFTSGANGGDPNDFKPQITSYDYDAPITEAGDITLKYLAIRHTVLEFLPSSKRITPPANKVKGEYGVVSLRPVLNLLDNDGRTLFGINYGIQSGSPNMERMNLSSYFMLYESPVKMNERGFLNLRANIADIGYVFMNNLSVGKLDRIQNQFELNVRMQQNAHLQVLVENLGHLNYGNLMSDYKGLSDLSIGNTIIRSWNCTGFPLKDISKLKFVSSKQKFTGVLERGPMFLRGYFNVTEEPRDTYLNTDTWGKGIAYINGYNLGRYWPTFGPQITLYVPSVFLRKGQNELVILEMQFIPSHSNMELQNYPETF